MPDHRPAQRERAHQLVGVAAPPGEEQVVPAAQPPDRGPATGSDPALWITASATSALYEQP